MATASVPPSRSPSGEGSSTFTEVPPELADAALEHLDAALALRDLLGAIKRLARLGISDPSLGVVDPQCVGEPIDAADVLGEIEGVAHTGQQVATKLHLDLDHFTLKIYPTH